MATITEDYCSYEVAKLLKEKGFDCKTEYRAWYVIKQFSTGCHWNACTYKVGDITREYNDDCCISIPTLQMAMKWLRETHHIHISIEMGFDVDNSQYFFYVPSVCRFSNKSGEYLTPFGEKEFGSYEKAAEVTIKYCLENLI